MTFGIPFASVPRPALAVIVLAVGLSGALVVYVRMTSPHQTVIEFNIITNDGATGYSRPASLVINDSDTWAKVWTQAYCPNPCEAVPPVNFNTRTVIAVFWGTQPGPLYNIKITQIVQSGSNITVHVLWTEAGNCGESTQETWPSYIVDIPKTESHITFVTETFMMHC